MKIALNTILVAAVCGVVSLPAHAVGSFEVAADNCYASGQQYAASQGATLVAAEATTRNGAAVCKVVILKQSSDSRPKREVAYIPQ